MISDPRKFVRLWLSSHKVTIDERGTLVNAEHRDNTQIFDSMYLDYCEQIAAYNFVSKNKVKAAPETNVQKALDELISLELLEQRKCIFTSLQSSGADLSPLQAFVTALIGNPEPKVVAVLAHYLWTIKRRLQGKPIVYQIMPILLGKQGTGKSVFVENLLKPIQNLTLEINLSDVVDPRYHLSFSKNFAIIINEMAGANKTDVEKLKNLITAKNNDVRKLHTNTVTKVKQNASLIGTTNKPVAEIIHDVTGARRFYEIRSLDHLDWSSINGIDYLALWRGIDETKDRGYYEEYQEEIKKDQEALIGLEELQVFLDLYNVRPGTKEVTANIMYDTYKIWCESNGVKAPFNSVWFGRRLQGKGFEKAHQKRVRGKNTLFYNINDESEMHAKSAYDPLAKDFQ